MKPNKQCEKFLNRKYVKLALENKTLTANQITRLNFLFDKVTCKETENMHSTIVKFIENDLNNYYGRYRRLKGIPGTNKYTQLLRYGKHRYLEVVTNQNSNKVKTFPNIVTYWLDKGMTEEEAIKKVVEVQKRRSSISPATQKGVREYSPRCVEYWLKLGYSLEYAKNAVKTIQSRQHSEERNKKWQDTLNSKTDEEKSLINLKKGHSTESYIARGYSEEDAAVLSRNYWKKRNNYSKSSQVFFQLLEQTLNSKAYYKLKNYEKQFFGKSVDFYDPSTKTVVEYYGDFWHRNPSMYKSEFTAYNKTSCQVWEEDERRIKLIKTHPEVKKVVVVWESDVKKNPQQVIEHVIKEIYNDTDN